MSTLGLKGRAAIAAALEAMKTKTEIEVFGLRYKVVSVSHTETAISESVWGTAELACTTRQSELHKTAN